MSKICRIPVLVGVSLLQACATPPAQQPISMQPVLRVHHSADRSAATFYQLGKYHQARGELELAREAYLQSIKLNRQQLEARNALATVYSQQRRFDEAKALLFEVIGEYPSTAQTYNNLGYVYFMEGNLASAIRTLHSALVLDYTNQRARNNLAASEAALAVAGKPTDDGMKLAVSPVSQNSGTSNALETMLPAGAEVQDVAIKGVTSNVLPPAPELSATRYLEGKDAVSLSPAAATPPPRTAATSTPQIPVAGSRMDIVEVAPRVYELKSRFPSSPVIGEAVSGKEAGQAAGAASASFSSQTRLEVSNGNGVTGMARRISEVLAQRGIAVTALSNLRPFTHKQTTIQYKAGYEEAASAVKQALRGNAYLVAAQNLSIRADVRVVLGKESIAQLADLERLSEQSVFVSNAQGEGAVSQ